MINILKKKSKRDEWRRRINGNYIPPVMKEDKVTVDVINGENKDVYYYVDILHMVRDLSLWKFIPETVTYSKHSFNFIEDMMIQPDCSNCNNDNCKGCRPIIKPAHFEFCPSHSELIEILISCGIPEIDAIELATFDGITPRKTQYRYVVPTDAMMKKKYPHFYRKLKDLINVCY